MISTASTQVEPESTCPVGALVIAPVPAGKKAPALGLVLPTLNEATNIERTIRKTIEVLADSLVEEFEIIVVDDNSSDNTAAEVRKLFTEFPPLRLIVRHTERGLATAVIRGWQVSNAQVLGVMDADLQHDPLILKKLLSEFATDTDLIVASRHVESGGVSDWSWRRRIVSRFAQLIGFVVLPEVIGRVKDPLSGFFLIRRAAIENRVLAPQGYKILLEVLARGKIKKIQEVGYVFEERQYGSSKLSLKIYLAYLRHLLQLRFRK